MSTKCLQGKRREMEDVFDGGSVSGTVTVRIYGFVFSSRAQRSFSSRINLLLHLFCQLIVALHVWMMRWIRSRKRTAVSWFVCLRLCCSATLSPASGRTSETVWTRGIPHGLIEPSSEWISCAYAEILRSLRLTECELLQDAENKLRIEADSKGKAELINKTLEVCGEHLRHSYHCSQVYFDSRQDRIAQKDTMRVQLQSALSKAQDELKAVNNEVQVRFCAFHAVLLLIWQLVRSWEINHWKRRTILTTQHERLESWLWATSLITPWFRSDY